VLKDLNLTLETGSFSFLTGASGAGKTSLMRMLFLALKPTRGMISLFGENIGALPRSRLPDMRRRIGVVFQEFRLLDHLTTFENVALPLRIRGAKLARLPGQRDGTAGLGGAGSSRQFLSAGPVGW
jgi:cell division transport system ATP-binding protein